MTRAPSEILQQIQDRLSSPTTPARLIEELLPFTHADAVTWARRLPFWDEYRGQYPDQVVALARVISRRAMKEFGLAFDAEGRVVEEKQLQQGGYKEGPTRTFPMRIGEETVEVRYTRHYFSNTGQDLFSFVGEEMVPPPAPGTLAAVLNARKPHPLSETGWWSQFASHDAVEACGGPEAYAALVVDARLRGEEKKLEELFEGKRPEVKRPNRRRPSRPTSPPAVLGEHTAAVLKEQLQAEESVQPPSRQGTLF